ncbi:AraC family transcriptional regulator [Streptomycetaceae bacterium NBC_01309]
MVAVKGNQPEVRSRPDGLRTAGQSAGLGYSGSDISQFQRAVAEHLAPYRLRILGTEPFRGRLTIARSGDVVVAAVTCSVGVVAEIEVLPQNSYFVTLTSGLTTQVDGGPVEHRSHVVGPGQRVRARWAAHRPVTIIKVSRRLVERVWRAQGGRASAMPLRFAVPLDQVAVRSGVWEALADAFVAAYQSGLLGGSTAVNARFDQLLAQTLLSLQPHVRPKPVRDPEVHVPHRAGTPEANGVLPVPAPVRRAIDFCHARAHEQLTVADIADAAGMSVRRLQATFRTHVGTAPIEYIKRVRLAGVHADLKRIADGTVNETITDAALRWGFTHLGRFSGIYRAEFGQLPSQTARNNSATRQ